MASSICSRVGWGVFAKKAAANIAPLASVKIIDDEVIARIAHGVQETALFIVQKAAAAFFGDQRVPPKDAIVAGVESKRDRQSSEVNCDIDCAFNDAASGTLAELQTSVRDKGVISPE